jgi:hypothetical protein
MCEMVCDGEIDIATAQQAFATRWIRRHYRRNCQVSPYETRVGGQQHWRPPTILLSIGRRI